MAATTLVTPGLKTFLDSVKTAPIESSIESLVSLLKRRQIKYSRPCAIATAKLLRRVVATFKFSDTNKLLERVQEVGQRLTAAQPRELTVGNIVRRVLGVIRDEAEEDRSREGSGFTESNINSRSPSPPNEVSSPPRAGLGLSNVPSSPSPLRRSEVDNDDEDDLGISHSSIADASSSISLSHTMNRPPLLTSHTSYAASNNAPLATSMFSLLSHPASTIPSPTSTPITGSQSPNPSRSALTLASLASMNASKELRAEVINGIEEIIDELDQADDQIASYALEHIHSNEIILTHSSSSTVQKFLLKAASKRKFTVIHAEGFPNDHLDTHANLVGSSEHENGDHNSNDADAEYLSHSRFAKPLSAAGITVILIPDSAVFALMSRVNKVILGTHVVLADGGLVAAAGAKAIAKAASIHRTPVVVVSGVYKLSPTYPFDFEGLIEYGDASKVLGYEELGGGRGMAGLDGVDVDNPLFDHVPAELVDLYITNLGGHAPSYLYRIVADHYRVEDTNLAKLDT